MSDTTKGSSNPGQVQYLSPDGLHKNPAYSNLIVVTGNVRTLYIGGQNAVDAGGNIVGKGDVRAQTVQVFKNIETALAAGGARMEHIVKWNIYLVQGQPLMPAFEAGMQAWGGRPNPPVITTLFVSSLGNPDFLVEVDVTAVVPE